MSGIARMSGYTGNNNTTNNTINSGPRTFYICKKGKYIQGNKSLASDIRGSGIKLDFPKIIITDHTKVQDILRHIRSRGFDVVEDKRRIKWFWSKPSCPTPTGSSITHTNISPRHSNNGAANNFRRKKVNSSNKLNFLHKSYNNFGYGGGKQFINIPNIGKRKIRYYKNGKPYVIIKGKKKRI